MKIIQYGCGKMSEYTMKYAMEKGHQIVGALDIDESLIGKDISEIIGIKPVGVKIENIKELENIIQSTKPDVCIITTMSLLSDCEEVLTTCAKNGVNAITTCEEAFFPFNSNPSLSEQIDKLAKENHCTITGSGYQDAFWGNLITTLAGSTQKIDCIKGQSSYNVEDYGIALAKAHGAGLTKEEFDKNIASVDNISETQRNELIESGKFLPSYMWNVNGWLCDKLGLTVTKQSQQCIPTFHNQDIESKTLNMIIKKGQVTGMRAVVTTETKEKIILITECIGKVYSSEDFDSNNWQIEGIPNTNLIIERPQTVELTCASVINRLEQLVNEKSGFIPTSQFQNLKYKI